VFFRSCEPRVGLNFAQAAAATAPSEANTATAVMKVHVVATFEPDDVLVSTDCPCWYGVDAFFLALYVCGNELISPMAKYHYSLNLIRFNHLLTEGPP
jgi:hypothetical protein